MKITDKQIRALAVQHVTHYASLLNRALGDDVTDNLFIVKTGRAVSYRLLLEIISDGE